MAFILGENLTHSVGIELTYSIDEKEDFEPYCVYDAYATLIRHRARKAPKVTKLVNHFGIDPGCVEISTKILARLSDVKFAFSSITELAKAQDLVTKTEYVAGCGGHIHVGAPMVQGESVEPSTMRHSKPSMKTKIAIYRDFAMHPAVSWAFADPYDNTNAALAIARGVFPRIRPTKFIDRDNYGWRSTTTGVLFCNDLSNDNMIEFFRSGVAPRDETIEFRIFDMAETVEQQVLHLKYALAWMNRIEERIKAGDKFDIWRKYHELPETMTVAEAIANFKAHVLDLGLSWNEYKRFTRNIKDRHEIYGSLKARSMKKIVGELQEATPPKPKATPKAKSVKKTKPLTVHT